jgi:hypothetical protein
MLKKKVRIYRKHVARLRQEISQRHLVAEDSNYLSVDNGPSATAEQIPNPTVGWIRGGEQEDEFEKELDKRGGGKHKMKNGRHRSAVSEQYWADRKDFPSSVVEKHF